MVDAWISVLLLIRVNKNEYPSCAPRDCCGPITLSRSGPRPQASEYHGTDPGGISMAIYGRECEELLLESVRILAGIHVEMDGQLAVLG